MITSDKVFYEFRIFYPHLIYFHIVLSLSSSASNRALCLLLSRDLRAFLMANAITRAVIASSSPSFLVSLDASGDTLFTISLTRDLGVDSHMGFGCGGGVNSGFIVEFKDLKRNCGLEVNRILTEFESRCNWRSQNKRDAVSAWWSKLLDWMRAPTP
ncbi:hypothetical protein BDE02_14G066100 [Populus trichocarpa]|nr:hypothetical protein BDE02_14G066100 [Populus trichocarpa]